MSKTIAYYHPREILEDSNRASDIRVGKMLQAFKSLGYEVRVIAGPPAVRRQAMRNFKREVAAGLEVEFVYGECTNAPIALAEKKILPANFVADYRFFSWLKRSGIPNGVFYRDVYWRFDLFDQLLAWPFSHLLKPLYYFDWYAYDKFWGTIFLPSEAMNAHLPVPREPSRFMNLPPGFDRAQAPRAPYQLAGNGRLNLLYVGGLEPAVYDLTELLRLVGRREDIGLTICCRESEWQSHRSYYADALSERVEVVHKSRLELAPVYHNSDLFLMLMPATDYMNFAVPVKFFEAIGYALPMVTMNQEEVAKLVNAQGIGWTVQSTDELSDLLDLLQGNPDELAERHQRLLDYRSQCTWESRAQKVITHLTGGRPQGPGSP